MVSKALMVGGAIVVVIIIYFLLPKDLLCPTSPNLKFSKIECDPKAGITECRDLQEALDKCTIEKNATECSVEHSAVTECMKKYGQTNILDYNWVGDNTLRISARGFVNCAASIVCPRYGLQGNTLILKFGEAYDMPFIGAFCVCGSNLTYEISGLERQDYRISISKE